MEFHVRQAGVTDAKGVADVLNSVIAEGGLTIFNKPFSETEERNFIASLENRSALFVAEARGEIVGVQVLDLFSNHSSALSHVAGMGTWLRKDVRAQGLGRLMAEQSFRFARDHGYGKIVIQVLAANPRALRFYLRLGFQEIGVARRHVRLGGEFHDEVFLEKHL